MDNEENDALEDEDGERAPSERADPEPLNDLHGLQKGERLAARKQRDKDILEARIAGYSPAQIGERFGITAGRVRAIISRILRNDVGTKADELVALYSQRHEDLLRAWWREARGIGVPKDPKAAAIVDRALDRLARLNRLDTIVLEHHGQTQDERAAAVGDAFEHYLQGVRDERKRAEEEAAPAADASANGHG